MSAESVNALPGWWGKLPGTGDFSHRRLADEPRAGLDDWLQTELRALRLRHAGWQTAYLGAPLWHFALGAGLLVDGPWLGVMMPSVDRVGRYFPLVIIQPVGEALKRVTEGGWWQCATEAALQALRDDCDPDGLERALADRFGRAAEVGGAVGDGPWLPTTGRSHWRHSAGTELPLVCTGWPRGAHFDLLFDLAGLPATIHSSA